MATSLNLATLNDDHPYILKIKDALVVATGQEIPIINVNKLKRISGISACPIDFIFAGNQKLTLFIRASADAFKATLNDKTIVLSGDFSNDFKMTFDNAVNGVAKLIRNNQKAFQDAQQKIKVKLPKTNNNQKSKSVVTQLKTILEQESLIDKDIVEKTDERNLLLQQIDLAKSLMV